MFAGGTCSAGSSTNTTASPRDRIRVSDPHGVGQLEVGVAGRASGGTTAARNRSSGEVRPPFPAAVVPGHTSHDVRLVCG